MTTASLVVIALVVAVLVGAAVTAWLWRIHCPRRLADRGRRALTAMRWREFSRFVVEGLETRGFEPSRAAPAAERGQKADLLVTRGGETWLLTCKQGVDHRVTAAMVEELARSVRISAARGGIVVTLGRIDPEVRRHAGDIELIDGAALWPLVEPRLPPTLHDDLLGHARRDTARATILTWVAVLVAGIGGGLLLSRLADDPASAAVSPTPTVTAPASPTAGELPGEVLRPAPVSEEEQRDRIRSGVATLPGIAEAAWASRSTLLVHLMPGATDAQVDAICDVVGRSQDLGSSRIQIEPAPGTDEPVRFTQCRVF